MLAPRCRNRGAMIILAMGLLAVLWFVVLAFANSSVTSLRLAQHGVEVERAQWAAEAGLRLAVQAVTKDAAYTPSGEYVPMARTTASYKVERFAAGKSPVSIPTDCLYLRSTGRDRRGVTRQMAAVVRLGGSSEGLLNFSVFANSLTLNGGCYIDSFDSASGSSAKGSLANVATNAVTSGAISLLGGSFIQGAIQVGVGGKTGAAKPATPTTKSSNVVWKDWSCWSLEESSMVKALEFPAVAAPSAGTTPVSVNYKGADIAAGSYGALVADGGGEVRLTGGTYVFSSITLSGGAKLAFKGTSANPAVVYVTKSLDLSGGTLYNSSASPKNMVFMLAKDVTAKMSGGAQAYAVVYGPEADFTLTGGTDLYGAIVGRTVTLLSGAHIHYDTDLVKNPPTVMKSSGSGGTSVVSFQRL